MGTDINKDNSFKTRTISGAILTVITIGVMLLGGYVLLGVLALISVIGLMELYRAVKVNTKPIAFAGYLFALGWYALLAIWGVSDEQKLMTAFAVMVSAFLVVVLAFYVISFPKYNSEQITMVFFGFFYVALTLSFIYRIRIQECGQYNVWLIFLASWGADTSAYLVGRKLGRHKIFPVLSPKKSLEGCIGGVVGSVILAVVYALIFKDKIGSVIANPMLVYAITAAAGSVVSMIGDLAASAIKRNKEIKDYGRLIPGHGGILDRFDSVIFVAPIVYYLLLFII